jgi:hypothetical protein
VSNFLMPHVADLPAVVAELARVVRPGGRVALTTWDPSPATFLGALLEAIADSGAVPPADMPPGPSFFQYAESSAFAALLSPLEDVSVRPLSFTHRVVDVDAFWSDLMGGTVRSSALILSQPSEVQAAVRRSYGERLAVWRGELPCAVKLGSGRKRA